MTLLGPVGYRHPALAPRADEFMSKASLSAGPLLAIRQVMQGRGPGEKTGREKTLEQNKPRGQNVDKLPS